MTDKAVAANHLTPTIRAAEKIAEALDLPTVSTTSTAAALNEAVAAADELAEALGIAGFALPSLHGDFTLTDRPLVHLGSASAELVRLLAAWIRERA
ncbi:hypothetical protein ACFO3J_22985 [Streptomyces polygonati]|uniref:Uncharacterized protein n=1 Tax=Streptomyces polygonati TaxID=1617087 RepID=A0ABV8HQN4_9ACTN